MPRIYHKILYLKRKKQTNKITSFFKIYKKSSVECEKGKLLQWKINKQNCYFVTNEKSTKIPPEYSGNKWECWEVLGLASFSKSKTIWPNIKKMVLEFLLCRAKNFSAQSHRIMPTWPFLWVEVPDVFNSWPVRHFNRLILNKPF